MDKTFDSSVPTIELTGGIQIPQTGFGTFKIWPYIAQEAVEQALELGYRHIDTAAAYANEKQVGDALAATGMADSVFVTSKLRNGQQGRETTLRAFDQSLKDLGLDAIDLYLIHWPVPMFDKYVETWETLIELQEQGLIRAIGVSNFLIEHLERLIAETGVVPAVNQIESHPHFWQPELDAYCQEHGIVIESYSPLGRGGDIESEPVCAAADRVGATPAQVVLRWHVQMGHVILPKSEHVERMRENMDIYGFELTQDEMDAISALDCPEGRISGDPREFDQDQSLEDMLARGTLKLHP